MSYKSKYGITSIKNKRFHNLSIIWDADKIPCSKHKRYPVLLYTPDMQNTNTHYHIQLTKKQTKKLKDWLVAYLKDTKK